MASSHKPKGTAQDVRNAESPGTSSVPSRANNDKAAQRRPRRCAVCKKKHKARMRKADPFHADLHLLEELAKPRACVNGRRITIWVYRDGPHIREIILSGHAETRTCAAATSRIIEAASHLSGAVQWMLTCGAAYFRVAQQAEAPYTLDSYISRIMSGQPAGDVDMLRVLASAHESDAQSILGDMIRALGELSEESGFVEIIERDWRGLERFRTDYRQRAGSPSAEITLPNPQSPGLVADFLPIVPGNNPEGKPLIFEFEGWDFDCPEFQSVADLHLRRLQRELLRDALRRRLIYRGWLKEWMEEWVPELRYLPENQAEEIILSVPPADYKPTSMPSPVPVSDFLRSHAATFVEKGQTWHKRQAAIYRELPFGQLSKAELDKPIRPSRIIEVDFERGQTRSREANETDRSFTMRERLMINQPQMISQCLLWIRRMDSIIKPYEEWEKRGVNRRATLGESPEDRQIRLIEQISRQIVVETMVRGWPSFYLNDKEDQKVFENWAVKYRRHAWALIERQCRNAGVALDILLEDNVVYDVRFNDNLGCTIQPLMLIDESAHAQLHGASTGASAVVPLWAHSKPNPLPEDILRLGATNRERAASLVDKARRSATGPQADSTRAAEFLRLALACHPAEAGKLILQEWVQRIGRDTSDEFDTARSIVVARELAFGKRNAEAKEKVEEYLAVEPNPVPDAYIILALSELSPTDNRLIEFRETAHLYNRTLETYKALAESLKEVIDLLQGSGYLDRVVFQRLKDIGKTPEDLTHLRILSEELDRLGKKLNGMESEMEEEIKRLRTLIETALKNPSAIRKKHPGLALAAEKAREELREVLQNNCQYKESEAMFRRYGDTPKMIEARGIFDVLYALLLLRYRIGKDPNSTRLQSLEEMKRLAQSLWVSEAIKSDLRTLAGEFGEEKGPWDRLQTDTIRSIIYAAALSCHSMIQGLLSDRTVAGLSMKESILTRIHLTQVLDRKYNQALNALLEASVPLGISISKVWKTLNHDLTAIPHTASFGFYPGTGTVSLNTSESSLPLIQCEGMTAEEISYVATIINDPDLPFRISPLASCVATGLLAVHVEPRQDWRIWRGAMQAIRREMLIALSEFGYEACLMPESSPPEADTSDDFEERMNKQVPRQAPSSDWKWEELSNWQGFINSSVKRVSADNSTY
jgi:hypothetical protein